MPEYSNYPFYWDGLTPFRGSQQKYKKIEYIFLICPIFVAFQQFIIQNCSDLSSSKFIVASFENACYHVDLQCLFYRDVYIYQYAVYVVTFILLMHVYVSLRHIYVIRLNSPPV